MGIDLHRRRSVIVRMSPEGERLSTEKIDNSAMALAAAIAPAGPNPKVVVEPRTAGTGRPMSSPSAALSCTSPTRWG